MAVQLLTQDDFDKEVKESKKLVLVDFFATWCMPCKMLAGVLEQVSEDVDDNSKVVKFDVDKNMDLAKEYGVMSVPTMIVMKDGQEVDRMVGFRNAGQILETLKKHK